MSEPSFPSLPPDDESADIVSRADALMRRTRPAPMLAAGPAAGTPEHDTPPRAPPLPDDAEDIPLLTDIVGEAQLRTPAVALPENLPAAELERLGAELVAALQARLAAEIPTLVEAAMQTAIADIARQLCAGLSESASAALTAHLQHRQPSPQPPRTPH
jgi:hypothetical protein